MPSRAYSALSSLILQFRTKVLAPERRRHWLTRVACRLIGIALMAIVIGIGMLLCSALVILAALQRLLRGAPPVSPPAQNGQVVEGQYRVVKPDSDQT